MEAELVVPEEGPSDGPADEIPFAKFVEIVRDSDKLDFPEDPGWLPHELRAKARSTGSRLTEAYVVRDGGKPVGALYLHLPLEENLHLADFHLLTVAPSERGKGHGRKLVEIAEEIAHWHGRTLAITYSHAPVTATSLWTKYRHFAASTGFEPALHSKLRRLRVSEGLAHATQLEEVALSFSRGSYEAVTWRDRCPEEIAHDRAILGAGMSTDAPRDGLEVEGESWNVGRLRDFEDTIARMDRDLFGTGAVDRESGELVAFTEITVPRASREVAYQYDTIVAAPHRGHRLGTLVKVVNLRAFAQESPVTDRIYTWNADSNDPMVRVNEAMGFEVYAVGTVLQKKLG
jgi:GNAT superfamily N-acetyltransferase